MPTSCASSSSCTSSASTRCRRSTASLTSSTMSSSSSSSSSPLLLLLLLVVAAPLGARAVGKYPGLEFLEPCSRQDPQLEICLARLANTLAEKFRHGLPQLGYPEVEPIVLDELSIALGAGPNGYKARFQDIEARGVSAVRVQALRASIADDEVKMQLLLSIPKIHAKAKYRSSGTLVIVQASGSGDYWGEYENVKAKVYIRAKPYVSVGTKYLSFQQLKLDFSVPDIKMGVEHINGGNAIIQSALNLFINSNSQELLKEMKPDLKKKLIQVMSTFIEKLFQNIPYDAFVVD